MNQRRRGRTRVLPLLVHAANPRIVESRRRSQEFWQPSAWSTRSVNCNVSASLEPIIVSDLICLAIERNCSHTIDGQYQIARGATPEPPRSYRPSRFE